MDINEMSRDQIREYLQQRTKASQQADEVFIQRMGVLFLAHAGGDAYKAGGLATRLFAELCFGDPVRFVESDRAELEELRNLGKL